MDQTASTIVDLFLKAHAQLRDLVRDMDADQLNWAPAPDTNSPAVLVTHTLASEYHTWLFVRDIQEPRDRDAEFRATATSADELMAQIDRADELTRQHGAATTTEDLAATRTRPERDPQIGLHWLVNNYGHAREHIGHLELTAQLYKQRLTTS